MTFSANRNHFAPTDEEEERIDAAFDKAMFHRSCYLSGPMTGYEQFNFPAFEKAAADLRSRGWKVYSPHELGWGDGDPETGQVSQEEYRQFMAEDLKQVCLADAVICLPGWEDSKGANLEVQAARVCGVPVLQYGPDGELAEIPVAAPPVVLSDAELEEWHAERPGTPSGDSHPRESVCAEADRLVSTDRQETYGHPAQDFAKVTEAARALGLDPTAGPEHHALYMVLVKLSRLMASPGHRDSIVDGCGYLKTYDMVLQEKARVAAQEG